MTWINWGSETREQLEIRRRLEEQAIYEQSVRVAQTRLKKLGTQTGGGQLANTGPDPWFWAMVRVSDGGGGFYSTLYKINVLTGETAELSSPFSALGALIGLAWDPVESRLWSKQESSGNRLISFDSLGENTAIVGLTFNTFSEIAIGADGVIRTVGVYNTTYTFNKETAAGTTLGYTGLDLTIARTGVAETGSPQLGWVTCDNFLWRVEWLTGTPEFICEWSPELVPGFEGPLVNPLSTWGSADLLVGAIRSVDGLSTRLYRLELDGTSTFLSSVPLQVDGLAWALGGV